MATVSERYNRQGQLIGWQVKVRKRGYPPQVKTFDKKKDAEAWATVIESEMVRSVYIDRTKAEQTTLKDAIDDYIREVAPSHKGSRDEILRLERFKRDEPKICSHALLNLTTRLFELYRDARLKKVTPGTVKRELGLLHTVIEYVRKSHSMVENPISDVRRPKVDDARDIRLHGDEAGKLLKACEESKNKWLVPAYLLALETAMRRSELLGLTWGDVDLEGRTARLSDTKNGTSRTIPLSSLALAVLDGLERPDTGHVIGTSVEGIKQAFERARSRAGMEHFNFHDLRHEATSRLFERGWGIMEVAAVTGHQDLQMLKRYTNLRAGDLAKKMG